MHRHTQRQATKGAFVGPWLPITTRTLRRQPPLLASWQQPRLLLPTAIGPGIGGHVLRHASCSPSSNWASKERPSSGWRANPGLRTWLRPACRSARCPHAPPTTATATRSSRVRCHAAGGRPGSRSTSSSGAVPMPPRDSQPAAGMNGAPNGSGNGNVNGAGPAPAGDDTSQAGRLRRLMRNLGMAAGVPGLGLAAGVAANGTNGSASESSGGNGTGGGPPPRPPPPPRGNTPPPPSGGGAGARNGGNSRTGNGNGNGNGVRARVTAIGEWGTDWAEDWDPESDLDDASRVALADEAEAATLAARLGPTGTPRDKWITPLLDFRAVTGAVDPDQERTEDSLQGEALANKDESQSALRYVAQIVAIPLITGFILSRALADPVLSFTLQNNAEAFAMTDRQKIEGAEKVHIEEARLRFDMAIGKLPPLSEEQILEHLREFAEEVQEEERHHNEQTLITVVSDSISSIVLFSLIAQPSRGRQALFNTLSRLFDGLSDIAKAVMIILIADTLLGYHSEEGWTGLIELLVGHYGFEAEEEALVIFVGVIPVVIDVFFKYWIFIGLNRISPGAVVTIKQIDTH